MTKPNLFQMEFSSMDIVNLFCRIDDFCRQFEFSNRDYWLKSRNDAVAPKR